jgi:hypothetical protein
VSSARAKRPLARLLWNPTVPRTRGITLKNTTPAVLFMEPCGTSRQGNYVYSHHSPRPSPPVNERDENGPVTGTARAVSAGAYVMSLVEEAIR